ncbi:conserved hypothetical protein [Trichinella spiralis]|uniref:hypothetical protein n=1 Tax=Trichinella spiralis TaxID=6334 RepID=UPI0001EFEE08|nr:conserved hypothetical protein [Trichinella spiralis]
MRSKSSDPPTTAAINSHAANFICTKQSTITYCTTRSFDSRQHLLSTSCYNERKAVVHTALYLGTLRTACKNVATSFPIEWKYAHLDDVRVELLHPGTTPSRFHQRLMTGQQRLPILTVRCVACGNISHCHPLSVKISNIPSITHFAIKTYNIFIKQVVISEASQQIDIS